MQVRYIFTQSCAFNAGTLYLHTVMCVYCRYVIYSHSHVRLMLVRQIFTQSCALMQVRLIFTQSCALMQVSHIFTHSCAFNAGTLYLHTVTRIYCRFVIYSHSHVRLMLVRLIFTQSCALMQVRHIFTQSCALMQA